ncbi:kinase-like protein [Coprinellus micaceus]|uniref:Kinase-like protein n=1 Tax=Coprinellus micaceus TaxID=71717 RepID=A0A4Y7SKE7_COPMI|nr:kinase-like protein [Coprinellus micaceus]
MVQVCSAKGSYKRMLSLEGSRAQTWLDALQTMLDNESFSSNPSETRGTFLKALLRLSNKTGLCPKALQLSHQVHKGEEPVDEGSFGEVYQGRIAGRTVAVKVFRVNQRTDTSKLMKVSHPEAIIWCQLYHANVLPCYGIHQLPNQSNRIGLVSPWMESGNISDYLQKRPSSGRLLLLSDIASGLSYLHENKIVHGDLKGPNILVSASGRACLADFGLSRLADPALLGWTSIRTSTAKSTGTIRWQAPELLNPDDEADPKTTTASDIYSYGCVCYEIMTGNVPFHTTKNHYSIPMIVIAGKRPPKPDPPDPAYREYGLTEPIWSFIEASWKQDPESRPTAAELQRSHLFSSLVDHRPTQDWGETSAAEFRRPAVPS